MRWSVHNLLGRSAPTSSSQGMMLLESLFTMAFVVEARDPYTGGHVWRVSQYARLLARELGLSESERARIALGGFLHDLGKIGVPDEILRKPDRLTDAEYAIMRTHPEVGYHLVQRHPLRTLIESPILNHHERLDGKGYPSGIADEAIPLDARIVGLADAFDAMTSQRPYRAAMPVEDALRIIDQEADRQFDPACADAFLSLGRRGALSPIHGHSDDGIPLQDCPICGPTVVIQRRNQAGDHVHCRACRAELELVATDEGGLNAVPTGKTSEDPAEVAPQADADLIEALVQEIDSRMDLQHEAVAANHSS